MNLLMNKVLMLPYRWCVYSHSIDGAVFYVGLGVPGRPFERTRRNRKWGALTAGVTYQVEIHTWTDDRLVAIRTEAELIAKLTPSCNQLMNGYTNAERNRLASQTHSGKVVTAATRERISRARKGIIPNGWAGRPRTEATKAKLRATRDCRPIQCVQTGAEFPSSKAAAKALALPWTSLRAHLRGDATHVRGLTFLRLGHQALVEGVRA